MPDLSQQIVRKIAGQIAYFQEFQNKQQKQTGYAAQLDSPITNYRNYYINLAKTAQRCQARLTDGNQYFNAVQKFMYSCGILDCSKMTFVNQNMEGQDSVEYFYQASTYLQAIQHTLARILDSYSQIYAMQEFNAYFVYFAQDFGFAEEQTQILDVLQLKLKMKAGFELFDENPLKAVKKFEETGHLNRLIRKDDQEDETPQDSNAVPKRVRRTFEEEFEHNQRQIEEWKEKYENADEWCASIIKFVVYHVKYSDFYVGVSQAAFGELIGGSKIENKALLHYFSDHFKSTELNSPGIEFVQALRMFLSHFKLPGEGQVIDRIMNAFSHQYALYSGMDHKTLHGLSYAVIMLNTDLHNSSIKEGRMTKEMFIANTKLIDYARQLSPELLSGIYDEILANPFTLGSIEDTKKKFAVLQRYFYIDDRDVNAQSAQQQPNDKHDDPELEQMRLIPRIVRYGIAFHEYVKFGFACFNAQAQTIADFPLVYRSFDSRHFVFMVEQLGSEPVQYLLRLSRRVPRSWTTQLCLQNVLKIYLSKQLALCTLRRAIIELYIDCSAFLDVPIVQRPRFDDSNTYIEVVSGRQRSQKPDQAPALDESRLDLIQFLIEFATYRLISDNSSKFFIPQAEFGESYNLLTEVMSRCVYFDILFYRAIPQANRQAAGYALDGFRADCAEFLANRAEKSDLLVQNYLQIFRYFERLGTIEKVKKIIVNASSLPPNEFRDFSIALAKSAEFEYKIFLNVEYSYFSLSRLISTLSVKLQENPHEFEALYVASAKSLAAVLLAPNERLGSSVAIQVHQLVLQYLMLYLRVSRAAGADNAENTESDNDGPIFEEILSPFASALQYSTQLYMISMIVSFLAVYLTLFEMRKARYNDFFRAILKIGGAEDAKAALREYYGQPVPIALLHAFIRTATAAAQNFTRLNTELMKVADNSLTQSGKITYLYQKEHVYTISQGICDLHFRLSELVLGQYDEQLMDEYLRALTVAREIQDNYNNYAPILFKVCKSMLFYGFNVNESFALDSNYARISEALYCTLVEYADEKRKMNQSLVKDFIEEVQRTPVHFDEAKQRFLRIFALYCIEHFEFDAKTEHCGYILSATDVCQCKEYQHSFLEWIRTVFVDNVELRRFVFQKLIQFVKTVNCGSFISVLKYIILQSNDYYNQLEVLADTQYFESFGSYCLVFNYYLQIVKDPALISQAVNIYSQMLHQYSHDITLQDLQQAVALIYSTFEANQQDETSESIQKLVDSQLLYRELQGRASALRFICNIDVSLFEYRFKKQVYKSLVELCEDEDADIRRLLKRVLLLHYAYQ